MCGGRVAGCSIAFNPSRAWAWGCLQVAVTNFINCLIMLEWRWWRWGLTFCAPGISIKGPRNSYWVLLQAYIFSWMHLYHSCLVHVVTATTTFACIYVCMLHTVLSLLKTYTYLPLTFVEHVVDLNGFVFGVLSAVDSADIQCHPA